jgi:HEAT repeat protein
VRLAAVETAAGLADAEYLPLFEKAASDEDERVRLTAVRALGGLDLETAREALMLAAVDADPRVRSEAITALEDEGEAVDEEP